MHISSRPLREAPHEVGLMSQGCMCTVVEVGRQVGGRHPGGAWRVEDWHSPGTLARLKHWLFIRFGFLWPPQNMNLRIEPKDTTCPQHGSSYDHTGQMASWEVFLG